MKRSIWLFCFPILLWAQGGAYKPFQYFEGSIVYDVYYYGKDQTFFDNNEVPRKVTFHIKDGNYIVHLWEARFPTTRLYIADSDKTYILDLKNHRAFTKEKVKPVRPKKPAKPIIGDTLVILGVLTQAYKVEKENGEEITYYVSDLYRVNLAFFEGKRNATAHFLTPGLEGRIPLKIIRKHNGNTIEITAIQIKPRKFNPKQFTLPPGIKILGYDFRR